MAPRAPNQGMLDTRGVLVPVSNSNREHHVPTAMTMNHVDDATTTSLTGATPIPLVSGPLVSAAEIAELFSVHPSTIRRQAREGRLPVYWVGSTPRFSVDEVASTLRTEANQPRRRPTPRRASNPPSARSSQPGSKRLDRQRLRADLYG